MARAVNGFFNKSPISVNDGSISPGERDLLVSIPQKRSTYSQGQIGVELRCFLSGTAKRMVIRTLKKKRMCS